MIRDAVPADVHELLRLIHALAAFEREPDQVENSPAALTEALFGSDPQVFALVAEVSGRVVGTAIYFLTYSTWTGTHGIHLEDIFVEEEHRSSGIGRQLMSILAARASSAGYRRLEWSVLDWNDAAIGFYRSLGSAALDEWTTYRLSGTGLASLAASANP